jgi:hypothetical protein
MSGKKFKREIVYKITFPNGKIYIGLISTDSTCWPCYFGSVHPHYVEKDFTLEQLRNFTLTREYLWESETATHSEARAKELELIRSHQSNNPDVGYNRSPRLPGADYPRGGVKRLTHDGSE